ncbi:MAG: class II fructose-bisphosphate aldolase, partial [Gammaproteobacteria bacterium]|nr:class II fructose-bisphosphate aldolase [Gammaproteobacteria bacterium]
MAFSILDCAESLQRPVIIGIASRHFDDIRAPLLVPSLLKAIDSANVPAVLHLDHAAPDQLDMIKQALDLGFSSIMIDGSLLPLDDNIEITHKVVELSHRYDASVEGEIGGIAGEEGVADTQQESPEDIPYTNVIEAQRFISATNVDALAIAVGTAHGIYKAEPHINFDVIKEIASITDIPLVMHGATGVSDSAIQKSITLGIRKINYFSGLLQTAMNEVRSYNTTSNDYHGFKNTVYAQWKKVITEQMKLFANTA